MIKSDDGADDDEVEEIGEENIEVSDNS